MPSTSDVTMMPSRARNRFVATTPLIAAEKSAAMPVCWTMPDDHADAGAGGDQRNSVARRLGQGAEDAGPEDAVDQTERHQPEHRHDAGREPGLEDLPERRIRRKVAPNHLVKKSHAGETAQGQVAQPARQVDLRSQHRQHQNDDQRPGHRPERREPQQQEQDQGGQTGDEDQRVETPPPEAAPPRAPAYRRDASRSGR